MFTFRVYNLDFVYIFKHFGLHSALNVYFVKVHLFHVYFLGGGGARPHGVCKESSHISLVAVVFFFSIYTKSEKPSSTHPQNPVSSSGSKIN